MKNTRITNSSSLLYNYKYFSIAGSWDWVSKRTITLVLK